MLPNGIRDMLVVRFGADGTVDRSFGQGGRAQIDFSGAADTAYAVAVDADGRILVAGRARFAGVDRLGVARLDAAGRMDGTFGPQGRRSWILDPARDSAVTAIAIAPLQRLVLTGWVSTATVRQLFVGRIFR